MQGWTPGTAAISSACDGRSSILIEELDLVETDHVILAKAIGYEMHLKSGNDNSSFTSYTMESPRLPYYVPSTSRVLFFSTV